MTDGNTCPKRDRMALVRSERREAGFCEVNVWVPQELSRAMRDLSWLIIDSSPIEFPYRGPRRDGAADSSDVDDLLEFLTSSGRADLIRQDGEQSS